MCSEKNARLSSRVALWTALAVLCAMTALAQSDPGVRTSGPIPGATFGSVTANNPSGILSFFTDAQTRFATIDSVSGTITGEPGSGLGPRYNSRSCARCHAQPNAGGTAPSTNPQVSDAAADGASNSLPSFISPTGPVREARFVYFTDSSGNPITSSPNGGVEPLFTIAGRTDSSGCNSSVIQQPNFSSAVAHNNVIFRIPTPVFGSGLMEKIDESTLLAVQAAAAGNPFGIAGTFNRNGNDGTIARFGWKAQNKSLELFSGEAYNVEMGVSNELFTQERPTPEEENASGLPAPCKINSMPEDITNFMKAGAQIPSDAVQFAMFMRLLAPPVASTTTPGGSTSISNGAALFQSIGCATCHTMSMSDSTQSAVTPDLSAATVNLVSDLEIHHMGTGLADNVTQGGAGGDQFRTAPLWGLGTRIFFLHDGRTTDLLAAISAHYSTGSEGNTVKLNFDALSPGQKQDILNFLRSL
ncbi:MAG TPA: di-heme oxidoredictase family protein [Thermoanaerobaculia bacterium]|jgi:CxxC motif-containing protein (DUF1111 family)